MTRLQKFVFENLQTLGLIIFSVFCSTVNYQSQAVTLKETQSSFKLPFDNCWVYSSNQISEIKFASDNEFNLYIPFLEGKMVSLNSYTGEKRWETELGKKIISSPLLDEENVYIAVSHFDKDDLNDDVSDDRKKLIVRSLDKSTGLTKWESKLKPDAKIEEEENLYGYLLNDFLILANRNGHIYSIDKTDGQVVWSKNLNLHLSSIPYANGDEILLGTSDNRIIGLSLKTGGVTEELNTPNPPTIILKNAGNPKDDILWGDRKGFVYLRNSRQKKLSWRFQKGGEISGIIPSKKGLLITSFDNFVYLISYKNGKLIWKKRLENKISAEPLISDDFALINANSESKINIVELGSGRSVNSISLASDNSFTGGKLKLGSLLIYSTLKGFFAFSPKGQCPVLQRNSPES